MQPCPAVEYQISGQEEKNSLVLIQFEVFTENAENTAARFIYAKHATAGFVSCCWQAQVKMQKVGRCVGHGTELFRGS